MDTVKTVESPYNNAVAVINRTNELLNENNIKDSTGNQIAQLEITPANPAWLFALACGSLHTSWQEKIAKAYSALDAQNCEDDQVLVLASIAGLSRDSGTPSHITATLSNNGNTSVTIPVATIFSESVTGHNWALNREVTLAPITDLGHTATVVLYSTEDGAFNVPSSTEFINNDYTDVTCISIAQSFEGDSIESLSSLRNRISMGKEQSDFLLQAMNTIKRLPAVESCSIWFNKSISQNLIINNKTIPPRTCYIVIKGVDITEKLADVYFSYLDIPATVGSMKSTCRRGMQDLDVSYDVASEVVVPVYVTIRASDAAAGADGAYREAIMAMSGTLGCGENLTSQKVSEWVQNVGYGTVIGCNVGTSTGITSNINPDEYVVFTPENIHIIRANVE